MHRGMQGAAGVMDEGGSGIDGMAGRPRKSWQMRKRQERAAIKEGLAEWQARTGAAMSVACLGKLAEHAPGRCALSCTITPGISTSVGTACHQGRPGRLAGRCGNMCRFA